MPNPTPTWVLVKSDDFSSYTSDADVEAAYAWPAECVTGAGGPSGYLINDTDWGPTYGPDGDPGIKDQVIDYVHDTGGLATFIDTRCRPFRSVSRHDFAITNRFIAVSQHEIVRFGYQAPDCNDGYSFVDLQRIHATSTLRIRFRTTPAYSNLLPFAPTFYQTDVIGAIPQNVPKTLEVWGVVSTVTGSAGSYAPTADGELHVLLDGVEVFSITDVPIWGSRNDLNPFPYWNDFGIKTLGALGSYSLYHDPAYPGCDLVVPPTPPPFCPCGSVPRNPPKLPPPTPPRRPPRDPMIGMQLTCLGDGDVPVQADFPQPESWWGL